MSSHAHTDGRPDPPVGLPAGDELPDGQLEAIAAIGPGGLIGRSNELPWRSAKDMAMFRAVTWGKTLLIGSATWVSIGRPLPGRNIAVLSRQTAPEDLPETVAWVPTIEAAAEWAADAGRTLMVAGGAQIYELAAPHIGCWWRTEIVGPGILRRADDTTIPALDQLVWRETWRSEPVHDDDLVVTFTRSDRRRPAQH